MSFRQIESRKAPLRIVHVVKNCLVDVSQQVDVIVHCGRALIFLYDIYSSIVNEYNASYLRNAANKSGFIEDLLDNGLALL